MILYRSMLGCKSSTIPPPIPTQNIVFDYKSGNGAISTVSSVYNGYNMVTNLSLNYFSLNLFSADIINHAGFKIDGIQVSERHDNMAPVTIRGGNIGGRHGYAASGFDVTNHDKTIADDIYSVWQLDGGTNQIILYTINNDSLYFCSRTTGGMTNGIYNHVSGAVHTSQLDLTVQNATPNLYPNKKIVYKKIFVDDVEKDMTIDGNWTAAKNIKVVEVYDIVDEESFKDYIVSKQGTGELVGNGGGDSILRVTNTFNVDETGFITGLISWEVLVDNLNFQYFITMQQVTIAGLGDSWYIPKTLPVITADGTFDLANIVPYQDLTQDLNYYSSLYEIAGSPPDRQLQILNSKDIIYTHGFLPVKDAAIGTRVNRVNVSMSIRGDSEKHYMRGINSDKVGNTLALGTKYEVIGYRGIIPKVPERTTSYFVHDYETGKGYMYADWHNLPKSDAINIPIKYQGKTFTVVEKTSNVDTVSGTLGSVLNINIDTTHSYGFLTIEINN